MNAGTHGRGAPAPSLSTRPLPFRPDAPWLAPLAGYSDLAFRLLCRENGAAVCCTEMISAKGLLYNSPGTYELLRTTSGEPGSDFPPDAPDDAPLVVQLFGCEPELLGQAVELLKERGFVYFDLNMGCSVPKVVKTGAGAALLRRPEAAVDAARALIQAAGPGRAGVKLRLGWNTGEASWREIAPELARSGAAWLTLHPRYGKEAFSGRARWECLKELKDMVDVPVIASGDLFSAEDAARCLAESGADAVMFARGAMHNPAVFAELKARLWSPGGKEDNGAEASAELYQRIRRHFDLSLRLHGERTTLLKMRTFAPRYARGISGARSLRSRLMLCRNPGEVEALLEHLFQNAAGGE